MHIVYHCVEGCHCSATAAAIHLNMLPIDSKPSYHDLNHITFFDNMLKKDRGRIILRGSDEYGNKVYTLCREYYPHIVLPLILDMWDTMEQSKDDLLLVNTQLHENRLMKMSCILSKKLNLSNLGKSLATKGTLKSYYEIANVVKNTKSKLH